MSVHEPGKSETLRTETLQGNCTREGDADFAIKTNKVGDAPWTQRQVTDFVQSALKRSPPSPSRMTALRKEKKRSEYSPGSTGLILC